MKKKFGTQLALGLGLLPFYCATVAAQGLTPTDASLSAEFAWLLGAAVFGFSVIARRSPRPKINPEPTSNTNSATRRPENWSASNPLM